MEPSVIGDFLSRYQHKGYAKSMKLFDHVILYELFMDLVTKFSSGIKPEGERKE